MAHYHPVDLSERMESVDLVRGYALLGVLLMNVQYWFRNPPQPYWLGLHPFPGGLNFPADLILRFWFEAKSVTLFSMLFAFGLCVQRERALAKGIHWGVYASRRLGAMLLFGILHIVLIWNGDILHWYAVCALLALPFLGREPETVRRWIFTVIGVAGLAILAVTAFQMFRATPPPPPSAASQADLKAWGDACIQGYQQSSWTAVMRFRLRDYVHVFLTPQMLGFVLFTFLNFLIGIWIFKDGVLKAPEAQAERIGRFAVMMLGIGVLLGAVLLLHDEARPFLRFHWAWTRLLSPLFGISQGLGIQPMALGIGGGLVWLWTRAGWKRVLRPLLPVGRMAFTNYIVQSLVSTFVFYGWGLGYYNHAGPAAGAAYSLVLFALQIPFSAWWLSRFRFGPLEWLWRCLTYAEWQPFRR
jgi:uncharacterized protein